ncbi:MAG TPA: MerR family transcriptional regulator [Nocardioidaceae bacterium]|jgi:DNA-binding transcriptional MerR regulator|nr:MerR family transcriptional regulator [Nocardioidaceae bacterium]
MGLRHLQIGEVAETVGLSLRTIRYYEEVGLITPSARTTGGFRLYSETDVARLRLIRRMKPLGFSLDDMREVLAVLDRLENGSPTDGELQELIGRLEMYREAAQARVRALHEQLEVAEGFAGDLRREISRQKKVATQPR